MALPYEHIKARSPYLRLPLFPQWFRLQVRFSLSVKMVLTDYTYLFAIGTCFAMLDAYNNGASECIGSSLV